MLLLVKPGDSKKNLEFGCHVFGSFGEHHSNPNSNIHYQVKARLCRSIVSAIKRIRYKVALDDGTSSDCHSNSFSKESPSASVPPDILPLLLRTALTCLPRLM